MRFAYVVCAKADEVDGEHVEEDDDDDDDNDDNDGDLVDDYMDGSGGGSPSEDEGGHVGDGKAKRDFFSMADMEKFVRDAEARAAAAEVRYGALHPCCAEILRVWRRRRATVGQTRSCSASSTARAATRPTTTRAMRSSSATTTAALM